MYELEKIKENIRSINPDITDELLDLLYEYFSKRISDEFKKISTF